MRLVQELYHCSYIPLNFPQKRYERNQKFKNVPSRSKSKFLFPPMSFLHKQQGEILTLLRVNKSIALVNHCSLLLDKDLRFKHFIHKLHLTSQERNILCPWLYLPLPAKVIHAFVSMVTKGNSLFTFTKIQTC